MRWRVIGAFLSTAVLASFLSVGVTVPAAQAAGGLTAPAILARPTWTHEGSTMAWEISLSHPWASSVSVDWATAPGSATSPDDFTASDATLTFVPGGPLTQTVTVDTIGDNAFEGNESLALALANPVNGVVSTPTADGTILDDDAPPVIVTADTVVEGSGPVSFEVALQQASPVPVTVDYTTVDGSATAGSDYAFTAGSLSFTPGGPLSQTVDVTVLSDGGERYLF